MHVHASAFHHRFRFSYKLTQPPIRPVDYAFILFDSFILKNEPTIIFKLRIIPVLPVFPIPQVQDINIGHRMVKLKLFSIHIHIITE